MHIALVCKFVSIKLFFASISIQATRCYVLLSHSACIWDIKNLCCDNLHDQSLACVARGCSGGVSFATCSTDGSIRLWDLSFQPNPSEDLADHHPSNTESISSTRIGIWKIFYCDFWSAEISILLAHNETGLLVNLKFLLISCLDANCIYVNWCSEHRDI